MGAIAPQRRISKTRKRQRRSHQALTAPSLVVCKHCGEMKLAHAVCKNCGYYDDELVKEIKVKEVEQTPEEKEAAKKEAKKAEKEAKKAKKAEKKADAEVSE